MRHYIAVAVALSFFLTPWLATTFPTQADHIARAIKDAGSQFGAVINRNPRTIAQLQTKYSSSKKENSCTDTYSARTRA